MNIKTFVLIKRVVAKMIYNPSKITEKLDALVIEPSPLVIIPQA